jgi:hypothetical protein
MRDPALLVGATTEAGIERGVPGPRARNRVLALSVFAAAVGIGTFGLVTALRKPNHAPVVEPSTAALGTPAAALPSSKPGPAPSPAMSETPFFALTPLSASASAPPAPKLAPHPLVQGGTPTKPVGSSPARHPPLPSATPASPAHDIF